MRWVPRGIVIIVLLALPSLSLAVEAWTQQHGPDSATASAATKSALEATRLMRSVTGASERSLEEQEEQLMWPRDPELNVSQRRLQKSAHQQQPLTPVGLYRVSNPFERCFFLSQNKYLMGHSTLVDLDSNGGCGVNDTKIFVLAGLNGTCHLPSRVAPQIGCHRYVAVQYEDTCNLEPTNQFKASVGADKFDRTYGIYIPCWKSVKQAYVYQFFNESINCALCPTVAFDKSLPQPKSSARQLSWSLVASAISSALWIYVA
eukprot:TRINITY_DN16566_c0_g1_i1.p1 TRINITY_DN16566_c0_g1~~TRINITY_DN16566_c0_g1_i1.p1  ORF type:complete len:261 (-),score=52.50 TRINITY_DN16566_c0_g1_i1:119-901(-)